MTYSVSSVEFVTIMFLSVAIVIVTIVITIIIKKMTLSWNPVKDRISKLPISPKTIDDRIKKIYLNYNGAYQSFNSSDIAYDEVGEMYLKQDIIKMYFL